jgi:hypothetical protein
MWKALLVLAASACCRAAEKPMQPRAAPLVACDSYFSIWPMSDKPAGDVTRHWTGTPDWTKLDWVVWTATLTEHRQDFETLFHPVYLFSVRSPNRVPLGDLYLTTDGKHVGMQTHPVAGGVLIKMPADPSMWKKWAGRVAK